jgi:cation:H+ antiporter
MSNATLLFFLIGIVLLIVGAEAIVRGASRLAAAIGISPLVIGLTVVAFGTSSPELAVSLQASLEGEPDIALGNVVGSNIFNILFILGLSALITPLIVAQQLVRFDIPILIVISILVQVMALDGRVGRAEGLLLFAGVIAYTLFVVRQSLKESKAVRQEYEQEFGEAPKSRGMTVLNVTLVLAGLGMLMVGSRWLVNGAVEAATAMGVSEFIIGLTIIAAGTSLPEVATSVMASLRGERDIAVGNVIGSCIFNILAILGLSASIAPDGINVPTPAIRFDIPVMIAVSVACLPILFTGYRIARWEGLLFLVYYVCYTGFLVLDASDHDALPAFSYVMEAFVIPITLMTLGVLAYRYLRETARA